MPQVATATNTTTVTLPRGQTRAAFEPATVDVATRSAELVWTTGARVLRHGLYGGPWFEELSLADDAVDLSHLNAGAPLLAAHRSAELDQVLGVVERAWLVGNGHREGRARVRFSKRSELDGVLTDVKDGILRGVSVGYITLQLEEVEPGDTKKGEPPVYRAVRWQPVELSLVPIGADPGAGMRTGPQPTKRYKCRVIPAAQEKPMPIAYATRARPRIVSRPPLPTPPRIEAEPDPLDAEIAARSTAAVDAALAEVRARPPARCERCGVPAHLAHFRREVNTPGWWRCVTCGGGTFSPPSAREEAEVTRTARATATAAVVAEAEARVAEATRTAWRPNRLTPALVRGMVEALLHRAVPQRYPATPASRTWRDHCPLRELIHDYLDAAGHPLVDVQAKGHALAMLALRRTGAPAFLPIAARAQGVPHHVGSPGPPRPRRPHDLHRRLRRHRALLRARDDGHHGRRLQVEHRHRGRVPGSPRTARAHGIRRRLPLWAGRPRPGLSLRSHRPLHERGLVA
jgi:hypothetical protein